MKNWYRILILFLVSSSLLTFTAAAQQKNTDTERALVLKLAAYLKDSSYIKNTIRQIETEKKVETQITGYQKLHKQVQRMLLLQSELKWLNMEAIRLAYEDMKRIEGFDAVKYLPILTELEQQVKQGFGNIYSGDEAVLANAEKAVANKRAILLANPLLNGDKILTVRYQLGNRDRRAMAPELGTQSNNWSNQESARRKGFNADIVELSNLRDEVQIRTIYKPDNTSSIADLKLHWDGDRAMFTQTMSDNRWNVFEVKLNNGDCKKLIDNPEPDLEFYDGTYLPDGRIIANSNIGYQGVPCVNGSDPVGNMVLYTPQSKNLRRLTFDQDANWNPVIMNNGRVMYTRWEYTDLTHYYTRIVMNMNPDGTEQKALYGSGAMFPNSTFDVQPLPGYASAFVGIISGHHGVARSGRLILFDPAKARKGAAGMLQEIPHRNRPIVEEVKDRLVDGKVREVAALNLSSLLHSMILIFWLPQNWIRMICGVSIW